MMKRYDITNELTVLFEKALFQQICIRGELPYAPDEKLINAIFHDVKMQIAEYKNGMVVMGAHECCHDLLVPFELRVAGKKDETMLWYNQTIAIAELCKLTLSPFEDNPDVVDIQIAPFRGEEAKLQEYLKPYENQMVTLSLNWNDDVVMDAEIYVHSTGNRAAGEGRIQRRGRSGPGTLQLKVDNPT